MLYNGIDYIHWNVITLYDSGGGGGFNAPPRQCCPYAFDFGATLLCTGDCSQKIVLHLVVKKKIDWESGFNRKRSLKI